MKTPAFLALFYLQFCVVLSLPCNSNQYFKDGKCCDKCRPGQKLVADCTDQSATQCAACEFGEFQDTLNTQKNCNPWSYCDPNAGFITQSEGVAEKDAVCVCSDGRHCSSDQCETCVQDTPCGPGFGVKESANKRVDTQCEPCTSGKFSNETSLQEHCRPWSRCETSQVEEVPGSAISDVICGPKKDSRTMVGVFVALGVVLCLAGGGSYLIYKKVCRKPKEIVNDPEIAQPVKAVLIPQENGQQEQNQLNSPQEDELMGNPVQEEGKESHMSKEEEV